MSADNLKNTSRTNWKTLESMSDKDIDYSDISPLSDEFFANAILRIPEIKAEHFVELDAEGIYPSLSLII